MVGKPVVRWVIIINLMLMRKNRYQNLCLIDESGNRKMVSQHNMNKKADVKLNEVAQYFKDTIPQSCDISEEQFLCKVMTLYNCEPVHQIMLVYDVENRFAAISYNLVLQSFYSRQEDKAYQFELQYEGTLYIRNAAFRCTSDSLMAQDSRAQEIVQTLNEPIIINKIMELNLLQVVLQYSMAEKRWVISLKSLAGSSTWVLIPPIMQTIKPRQSEIYALVEVMRMIQSAIQ